MQGTTVAEGQFYKQWALFARNCRLLRATGRAAAPQKRILSSAEDRLFLRVCAEDRRICPNVVFYREENVVEAEVAGVDLLSLLIQTLRKSMILCSSEEVSDIFCQRTNDENWLRGTPRNNCTTPETMNSTFLDEELAC